MRKIKNEFVRSGFTHKLVKRTGCVAIYKRRSGRSDWHYEIVKISSHNGYKLGDQYVKPAETYPGASLWGIQGWTCTTLEKAQTRFKEACVRFNKTRNNKSAVLA